MATIEKEITVGPNYVNRQQMYLEESVHGSLSPYDIPDTVSVKYDARHGSLMIEFKYMTPNEPKLQLRSIDDVVLAIGQFSGKLYTAEVSRISKGGIPAAMDEVRLALQKRQSFYRIESPVEKAPLLNFILMEDILSLIRENINKFEVADSL